MADREKVKKGLECCLTLDSPCGDCPYYSYEYIQELDCERKLRNDAISLLKEQDELLHKKQKDIDRLCNEISEWKHKFHDISLKEQEQIVGRWISIPHKKARICNICQADEPYKFADDDADVYDFCPHCGAKMGT